MHACASTGSYTYLCLRASFRARRCYVEGSLDFFCRFVPVSNTVHLGKKVEEGGYAGCQERQDEFLPGMS
eukprot:scaffold633_cov321-Pavlova_lutheri.AAC.11